MHVFLMPVIVSEEDVQRKRAAIAQISAVESIQRLLWSASSSIRVKLRKALTSRVSLVIIRSSI